MYVKIVELNGSDSHVSLEQESGVQGALLALDNSTGDIKAMVGGRDFEESKFNRATQAERQVGSSFKPYIYTAAIDQGLTPDDTVLDAPISFSTPSGPYTPHNYDGKFEGVITFRHALAESRNIPALKVTERVGGIKTVIEYARKFGITSPMPAYLPVALGAADITLAEQTAAFTTFPNDGVRVIPRYIRKVTDYDGRVLEENYPEVRDVVSARTARIMVSMLQEVIKHGTGYAASKLNHPLGGKTGTTNDFTDAWFVGFSPSLTCGVWVGYDEKKTLGNKETGAMAALPIWIDFMRVALQGRESEDFAAPPPSLRLPWRKKRTRKTTRRATARRIDAAILPIRSAGAGAGGGVHGFGADGDALCHPWPPDEDSQARWDDYIASRACARRSRAGAPAWRPFLQLRRASGTHHVAGSSAGRAGAARLARARCRKHGPAARRHSRSPRRQRARRRNQHPPPRPGAGQRRHRDHSRRANRSDCGAKPAGQCGQCVRTENQCAAWQRRKSAPRSSCLISWAAAKMTRSTKSSAPACAWDASPARRLPPTPTPPKTVPSGTRMVVRTIPGPGQRVYEGQGISLEVTR